MFFFKSDKCKALYRFSTLTTCKSVFSVVSIFSYSEKYFRTIDHIVLTSLSVTFRMQLYSHNTRNKLDSKICDSPEEATNGSPNHKKINKTFNTRFPK